MTQSMVGHVTRAQSHLCKTPGEALLLCSAMCVPCRSNSWWVAVLVVLVCLSSTALISEPSLPVLMPVLKPGVDVSVVFKWQQIEHHYK